MDTEVKEISKSASQFIEVAHLPVAQGRATLRTTDWSTAEIPSIAAWLEDRWLAEYKGKSLDPGENRKFLTAVLTHIATLNGVATQRDIYYAIRGAHPDWTYKGEPLGQLFYDHMVMWIMEKLQLMTGMTMQSMGVVAGFRGYIVGDGFITTPIRGKIPLSGKPTLAFDLADDGATLQTGARKVIHFEKESGLEGITANNFPRYVEAVFSTSSGQLSEAATKFLRQCEDRGMTLFSVHDGDPAGIQMQLMYGMASKNNCYMPSEFYPHLVQPLGFYPSIGVALNLPPEDVTDKEDRIFDNLLELLEGKTKTFPELRRFGLAKEVGVIIQQRQKWEFQALSAIHETAPKIFILEGLRVHGNEVKHVPAAESIKNTVVSAARATTAQVVDKAVASLADSLLARTMSQVVAELRNALQEEIKQFEGEVQEAIEVLINTSPIHYRERVKRELLLHPEKYAAEIIAALGKGILSADFNPRAILAVQSRISDISSTRSITVRPPTDEYQVTTKTMLVNAIEREILPAVKKRSEVVNRIRVALENRFGAPEEKW